EERVQPAGAGLCLRRLPVQVRFWGAAAMQLLHPPFRLCAELRQIAELDRLGGAMLGASGDHVLAQPVVAESALPGAPVVGAPIDHPERAGGNAIAAPVADVRLH